MLPSIFDTCIPRDEILSGELSLDLFAAKLRLVVETNAPRVLSPSSDIEIYNIVKQRLFVSIRAESAKNAATEYLNAYRASRISLPEGCKDARYVQAIESSYPFHPELFDLLTKKIAEIPEFQGNRGVRLFARVVRHLWKHRPDWIPLIHPHHVPVGWDLEITNDLTSGLQRPLMRLPIQADIYNPDGRLAHAQVQDQEWLAAGQPPLSTWVGRTIFLHSLTQGISSGIRRPELNLSLLTPGLEITFVDRALERLSSVAWYLDNDPITLIVRFKEEPSINKIIAEEKEQCGVLEAKDDLRSRWDTIFANKLFNLVCEPEVATTVDDNPETVCLCLIDFNEATVSASTDGPPSIVEQMLNNTGESGKFRPYRNRLLFLVANKQELARAIDNAREYRALQNILKRPHRLDDLPESQQKQLQQKEREMELAVRVSLTNAYRHLFYRANDSVKAPKGLMHYILPAQDYKVETQATVTPPGLFQVKPNSFDLEGTPSSVFNSLSDDVRDYKVKGIAALEFNVGQVVDYRKLGTILPLLARFSMQIEQNVTIQTGDQFVHLEYQGPMQGFQSFFTPTTALLNTQDVQANVAIKLIFEFNPPVQPGGSEINALTQALSHNPVERMKLTAKVTY